jgi:hypothetical protein
MVSLSAVVAFQPRMKQFYARRLPGMANNFRVDVIGGDMKRLNLKILGDFDGTSAFRLLNVIEKKGGSARKITIDTDGLRSVNTFGTDIFRANIAEMSKGVIDIDYTGRFKEALTEG